jgi:hypothetical protein
VHSDETFVSLLCTCISRAIRTAGSLIVPVLPTILT